MGQNYPDQQDFAFSFVNAEITANGRIWTAITGVNAAQPTEEGEVRGTSAKPLKRTVGAMAMGEGTLTFSDEAERMDFIDALGDGYREKIWEFVYTLRSKKTGRLYKVECFSCRVLDNPIEHEEGADALGGDVVFSYMDHAINGKRPHS
jgi:hypothetical protein